MSQISFENDIKPLFIKNKDKACMDAAVPKIGNEPFKLDLHNIDDVKKYRHTILLELVLGKMPKPIGRRWDMEKIKFFAQWMDSGMNP